jgi:hypothetical protein
MEASRTIPQVPHAAADSVGFRAVHLPPLAVDRTEHRPRRLDLFFQLLIPNER